VLKKIIFIIGSLLIGFSLGYLFIRYARYLLPKNNALTRILSPLVLEKQQVIGFLPYWLTASADKDYAKYLTTLTYFSLTVGPDGSITKLSKPGEEDPGWRSLSSGKMDTFFNDAKNNNLLLSLLVFNGDENMIYSLISDPVTHAKNLVEDIAPLMKQYGFKDVNLDIESVLPASDEARQDFTMFVREVKKNIDNQNLGTLTVDASPIVLIKKYLIDLSEVGKLTDNIVLMTYDFHYPGSYVTGPVAPIGGAGIEAEFDSDTSIKEALKILPAQKILLGLPLYGYEWETLGDSPRSAVIPGSGLVASNRRVEKLIASCATCSARIDKYSEESYLIYQDQSTGTYHQFFYPDAVSTAKKIQLANHYQLGGVALLAIGYDGDNILDPIKSYK